MSWQNYARRTHFFRHQLVAGPAALVVFAMLLVGLVGGASSTASTATAARPMKLASYSSMSTKTLTRRAEWNSDYARALGHRMCRNEGWHKRRQWRSLKKLWRHESSWHVHAANRYSAAYGIPQANPGRKMHTAGPHWKTNAHTQIKWGLRYIRGRYHNPRHAWRFWRHHGWY